ncbi:MAG: hypothetical protein ACYC0V_20775 [Armatimonadota bacterium]
MVKERSALEIDNLTAGDTIDIDSDDLTLYATPDILAEVQATIASLIRDETSFSAYSFAGEVTATKGVVFTEQLGVFNLKLTGTVENADDYEITTHGEWNASNYETIEVDEIGEIPVVIRLTIVCHIDNISKL